MFDLKEVLSISLVIRINCAVGARLPLVTFLWHTMQDPFCIKGSDGN